MAQKKNVKNWIHDLYKWNKKDSVLNNSSVKYKNHRRQSQLLQHIALSLPKIDSSQIPHGKFGSGLKCT